MSLQERCPDCRAPIRARQRFCHNCGASLAAVQGTLARVRTPKHLASLIISAGASKDGEHKLVTLLFADVANSTALISDLDADEANRILEPTLDRMIAAVHRYEGTTAQTTGDGIMAIFGAPIAHEDHAVRACYAALDMQEALRAFAADLRRESGLLLQVRVGINSGQVLVKVKQQEGDVLVDYRATGVTTHIASRLQALAAPGTILLTRDSFSLARGFVRVGPFEQVTVKGLRAPLDVCVLYGVNTRMRMHALAARGLSKFVGRKVEMEMLGRAAMQVEGGRGQVIALIGEAGVGKSRIFWEFTHSPVIQGWLVLDAGSVSYGKATSYLPLVDLLTRYFQIQPRDDQRRVREKISGRLFALGEEKLVAQMPLFLGALGWGDSDETWKGLAPAERQRALFGALRHLLLRESQEQPLCVVFEDLHWIDAETQSFLDMLLDSIPAAKVLLLVNFRPDEYNVGRWAEKSCYSQARLDPLPSETAEELLENLLGENPQLAPIKQTLIRVTEGNPLFLEEYVRTLVESGVLAGGPGHFSPIAPLPAVFVPPSIKALLAARIDRLEPRYKEVLQCAAVIGNDVQRALLAEVTALPEEELEEAVRELQAAEFLYEKTVFPETEYTFKHSMTREVAYSSLPRERKRALHAKAAQALAVVSGGRLEEQVPAIALHAEQGQLWPMAVEYLQRSGEKAFGLYANAEAQDYFERALVALGHLPRTRATLELGVDLRFEMRNALIALCKLDLIRKCLEDVEPILAELGDAQRSARYAAFRCNHHFLAGEQHGAIEFGQRGLRLARECGDRRLEAELLYRIGQSYHMLGDHKRAIELIELSIAATSEQRERDRFELSVLPAVVARTWLVSVLTECGDFAAGLMHAERALAIAKQAQHPLSEVLGSLAVGHVLERQGHLKRAIEALEAGMALSDRYSIPMWRLRLVSALGMAYAYGGRTAEGLELTRRALAAAVDMHLVADQPILLVYAGQASLLNERIDEALAHGVRALEIALAHEDKRDEGWARLLIARAQLASGEEKYEDTAVHLQAALDGAKKSGARPLEASCYGALAVLTARRGKDAAAKDLGAAAAALYAELDMRPLSLEPAGAT